MFMKLTPELGVAPFSWHVFVGASDLLLAAYGSSAQPEKKEYFFYQLN
jgi:hypothetical protein